MAQSKPDDDLDDLDAVLGGGLKGKVAQEEIDDFFSGPKKKPQQEVMMRDTLGFLKAADNSKKEQDRRRK